MLKNSDYTYTYNGISHFFFFLTPAALAIGALLWLVFAHQGRDFVRDISQDSRQAALVGSQQNETQPMKIEIAPNSGNMLLIDKIDFSGDRVWVRYRNSGDIRAWDISIGWMLKSPDGTILKHGSIEPEDGKGAYMLYPGESAAFGGKIDTDRHATTLAVRIFWKTKD